MPTRRSRPGPWSRAGDGRGRWAATSTPDAALAAHVAAIRELFEEAGVLLADVAGGPGADRPRSRGTSRRRDPRSWRRGTFGDDRRGARSAAPNGPARAAVALGDAADPAAPVRRPVLRRGAARGCRRVLRGRRGRRARLARRRPPRSERWPTARSGCGCRRARRSSSSSTQHRSPRCATRLAPGRSAESTSKVVAPGSPGS